MNEAGKPIQPDERKIVLLLCLLAAIHVFVFSAAFPFFNNVDEQAHVDLVVRYARLDLPRAIGPPCPEALTYLAGCGTLEYLYPPAALPGGQVPPPLWKLPPEQAAPMFLIRKAAWDNRVNHEAAQPPLYYALAGLWWDIGKLLRFEDVKLLYWLRFLNIPLAVALAWLGWRTARVIFPENRFIALAVPALIAFLPQSIFYGVNNDIVSPLAFGAAFLLLLKFWTAEIPSARLAAAIGLALAAAFLTKISNLPLLAVAALFLARKIFLHARSGRLEAAKRPLAILIFAAGLPTIAWMVWCKMFFGDFTGSAEKIQFLHWTANPLAAWLHHPLFTPAGLWFFISKNLATFWQGEFVWHGLPLALPAVNATYVVLTAFTLVFVLAALRRRESLFIPQQRAALWLGFACIAASFAFFALLSVKYDFHDCFYPSRAKPFFVSGRLMLGMLIPFLILFAGGLDRLMKNFQSSMKFLVLCVLLAFMLISEIITDWPVFGNEYNWFHS